MPFNSNGFTYSGVVGKQGIGDIETQYGYAYSDYQKQENDEFFLGFFLRVGGAIMWKSFFQKGDSGNTDKIWSRVFPDESVES